MSTDKLKKKSVPYEHVIWNVVKMTSVFEPGSSSWDVISCTFAFHFNENDHIEQVSTVPFFEWFQKLKTLGFGVYVYFHT